MELSFLRHRSMVEHLGAGDTIKLSVLELAVEGRATVMGVEACPHIDQGIGKLATGTIRSHHLDVRSLRLRGLDEPIEVTGSHPIFSEDAMDFVPVRELKPGERLRTRSGEAVVESIGRTHGKWPVFNLEIEEVHQYYVSEQEVLAHNAGDCLVGISVNGEPLPGIGNAVLADGEVPLNTQFVEDGGHNLVASLYRDGNLISERQFASGDPSAGELQIAQQQGLAEPWRIGDTENRAIRAIDLQPGDSLVLDGQFTPCESCQSAMISRSMETGAEIQYRFLDHAGNVWIWSAQQGGYIYAGY
jgi:hypothetical protein